MLTVPLPTETIVMDGGHRQLLKFEGILCLPIGTRIHIDNVLEGAEVPLDGERFPNGHADAIVTGIRLWGTQSSARALILDVELREPGSTIWSVSELA
jgi:hypothetical protein